MKKFKKIKLRVPRIPENAKIMSLMAIILICAAPALVSVIDDEQASNYNVEIPLDYTGFSASFDIGMTSYSTEDSVATVVSDEGILVSSVDPTLVNSITAYRIYYLGDAFGTADPSTISLAVNDNPTSVLFRMIYSGGVSVFPMSADDSGTYYVTLSSADKVFLSSQNVSQIMFFVQYEAGTAPAVFDADVTAYGFVSIPYGEIIVGATGVLLLICALFATPYFGLKGGYTGPRPKRRGA